MAGRPNWYSEHPPACTCAECSQSRLSRRSRVRLPRIGCLGVLLGVPIDDCIPYNRGGRLGVTPLMAWTRSKNIVDRRELRN